MIESGTGDIGPPPAAVLGTKALALQKALRAIDITGSVSVRIDEDMGVASIIDVIRVLCPEVSGENAAHMFLRIVEKDDRVISIASRTIKIKINGRGRTTPCTDVATLVEIIWMLPSSASRVFRRKSAETICRVLGGDLTLCREVERRNLVWNSIEGGEVIQEALIDAVEYKADLKRVHEFSVRDALALRVGGNTEVQTPSGFIDVLSESEVIEVKYFSKWKDGLGQVLAYQSHYPRLGKRLHLFAHGGDNNTAKYVGLAKSVCGTHGVRVTFEQVESLDEGDADVEQTRPREKRARCEDFSVDGGRERPASAHFRVARASVEIECLQMCRDALKSVGRYFESDKNEFADRVRDVQRRAMRADFGVQNLQ